MMERFGKSPALIYLSMLKIGQKVSKVDWQVARDAIIYGHGYKYSTKRKWWNPLRYIFGKVKEIRIDPSNIYIDREENYVNKKEASA